MGGRLTYFFNKESPGIWGGDIVRINVCAWLRKKLEKLGRLQIKMHVTYAF